MKLATLRIAGTTHAVRRDGSTYTEIGDFADVGALLKEPNWREAAAQAQGAQHKTETADLAPVIPSPGKIICVGANYLQHIVEMGSDKPDYPTLFAKYPESLIGAYDDIDLPPEDEAVDWEAELAVVIAKPARRIQASEATEYIAGYSIVNDVSMRGYQFRTMQWLQGKTWEKSTPFGPYLVTPDEFTPGTARISTKVDGETVQEASIDDLVFTPEYLVAYISTILTLNPGDVVITGTPSGVGHAQDPQRYLTNGSLLETSIEGLGTQQNRAVSSSCVAVRA